MSTTQQNPDSNLEMMEVRQRRSQSSPHTSARDVVTGSISDNIQAMSSTPRELPEDERVQRNLPPLTFKPIILRTVTLCLILGFNLLPLGLLLAILFYGDFDVGDQWGYVAIKVVPPVLGTITATLMQGVAENFSRITPFMLAASQDGSTFHDTLLASYFPGGLPEAVNARNKLLICVWILEALFGTVLSFKSALLNTTNYEDYVTAFVTPWALYALIGLYVLLTLLMCVLAYQMYNRVTGLRWDPESLADCLTLFRRCDFLDRFEGTDIAARSSMSGRFQHDRLKLGYWIQEKGINEDEDDIWHSFRSKPGRVRHSVATPISSGSSTNAAEQSHDQVEVQSKGISPLGIVTKGFTPEETYSIRYRVVALNIQHHMVYVWVSITVLLLAGFISILALDFVHGKEISIPYTWATVVFQFVPAFTVSLYTWFWEDVDHSVRSTQPFKGMDAPNPASENLLLNYSTLPPLVVTHVALKNGHYRVAWTSLMTIVQRLLPILTAASTTVIPGDTVSTIYASKPLFICITVWLGLYCFLIPLEIFGWKPSRHNVSRYLPRCYSSLADLLSWTYASKLLRSEEGEVFNVPVKEPKNKQWYMTNNLMLKMRNNGKELEEYAFGLYQSTTHENVTCMGIDIATSVVKVEKPKRDGEAEGEMCNLLSPQDLTCVLEVGREQPTNMQTLVTSQRPPMQVADQDEEQLDDA